MLASSCLFLKHCAQLREQCCPRTSDQQQQLTVHALPQTWASLFLCLHLLQGWGKTESSVETHVHWPCAAKRWLADLAVNITHTTQPVTSVGACSWPESVIHRLVFHVSCINSSTVVLKYRELNDSYFTLLTVTFLNLCHLNPFVSLTKLFLYIYYSLLSYHFM